MNYNSFGNISVRTYTASEALPIAGSLVKIYGTDDYNKDVQYSLLTDNDGITKSISLPAPSAAYSSAPGAGETPYSVYNVEITKNGYYPKRIDNVPIFSGINALLPIEMIPLSYASDGSLINQKNLNSVIYENENL